MLGETLPIFDSLTHPTISGKWIGKCKLKTSSFSDLSIELSNSNIYAAIASTFPSNELISPESFSLECCNSNTRCSSDDKLIFIMGRNYNTTNLI